MKRRAGLLILFLLIVIPIGLLAAWLSGLIGREVIAGEAFLDSVAWEFARPEKYFVVDEPLKASYEDDGILATSIIYVYDYRERAHGLEVFGDEVVFALSLNLTTANRQTFIMRVNITFNENYTLSGISWYESSLHARNLSVAERIHRMDYGLKYSLRLNGANNPRNAYFSSDFKWRLHSHNNQSHQMDVTCEITYYNGTAIKKVVQPFRLTVFGSNNHQYIEIHTVLSGASEAAGVKVWIDDVEYLSPVLVVLPAETRTIRVETPFYINSKQYVFDNWSDGATKNPRTLPPESDLEITVFYDAW